MQRQQNKEHQCKTNLVQLVETQQEEKWLIIKNPLYKSIMKQVKLIRKKCIE